VTAALALEPFKLDAKASGLDLAERWLRQGLVAGLNGTLGTRPIEVSEGYVLFECALSPSHSNFVGIAHGGVAAALVDIAGGAAAMTLLAPGETLLTSDLAVRYLAPARLDAGPMTAQSRVTHQVGRRVIADVDIRVADKTVATGSVSVSIRSPSAS